MRTTTSNTSMHKLHDDPGTRVPGYPGTRCFRVPGIPGETPGTRCYTGYPGAGTGYNEGYPGGHVSDFSGENSC
eukprot:32395-Rhodomonas_salina.1